MSRILIVFGTEIDQVLDKCSNCHFKRWDDEYYCAVKERNIYDWTRTKDGFPDWCPLPEVPDNPKKEDVKLSLKDLDNVKSW